MTPLRDNVLLEILEKAQEEGLIAVPKSSKEKSQIGKVLAVGKDVVDVGVGHTVVFRKFSATTIDEGIVVAEEDILCIKK